MIAVAAFTLVLGGACEDTTAPDLSLPAGARRFTPEPVFREWWAQVEACAGRQASFDAVSWYVVPGEVPFEAPGVARAVLGYWHPADNRIVLLEWVPNRTSLVRHEASASHDLSIQRMKPMRTFNPVRAVLLIVVGAIFFVVLGLGLLR